ncbi:MAG: protein translocase subunit SecF [Candidatus Paceibacterota bacterium]
MFITQNKTIFFTVAAGVALLAAVAIASLGLKLGIEFTGGSTLEVSYVEERPAQERVEQAVVPFFDRAISVRPAGDNSYIIQTPYIEGGRHSEIIEALTFGGERDVTEERFSSVGPSIGEELRSKALIAIALVVLGIVLFVAFSFRRGIDKEGNILNEGVSSWYYGFAAVVALVFDTLIPAGLFAVLGVAIGAEVDLLFVTALLAIIGFSVNDTIVVFDRVRENLQTNREAGHKETFAETVGKSLTQSFARSINTSLTTSVVLIALYVFGGAVTQAFALTLLVGVLAGTYSSLFIASPLLVQFQEWSQKKKKTS